MRDDDRLLCARLQDEALARVRADRETASLAVTLESLT